MWRNLSAIRIVRSDACSRAGVNGGVLQSKLLGSVCLLHLVVGRGRAYGGNHEQQVALVGVQRGLEQLSRQGVQRVTGSKVE